MLTSFPARRHILPAAILAMAVAQTAQASVIYNAQLISPVDTTSTTAYSGTSAISYKEFSTFTGANQSGQVLGTTNIYNTSGTSQGSVAWVYSPAGTGSTVFLGLTDASHTNSSAVLPSVQRTATARGLNASGQAAGTSAAYTTAGSPLGNDAWFYNGTGSSLIDMTTLSNYSVYSNATSPTVLVSSTGSISRNVVAISDSGIVIGTASMYTGTSQTTKTFASGTLGWVYDSTQSTPTLVQVGVTANATGSSSASQGSDAIVNTTMVAVTGKIAVGYSSRYQPAAANPTLTAGSDAWYYNAAAASPATVQIGLIGTASTNGSTTGINGTVTFSSTMAGQNYAAIGTSGVNYTFTSGLVTNQASTTLAVTTGGLIVGNSQRYTTSTTSWGNDFWIYDPSVSKYTVIGLDGTNYDKANGSRSNFFNGVNNAGTVLGTATRQTTAGTLLGTDTWLYKSSDGSTTTLMPTVPASFGTAQTYFEAITAGTYENISGLRINNNGLVAGQVSRYTTASSSSSSAGTDVFVYDSASSTYYNILPTAFLSTDTYATVGYISDSGIVLGTYGTSSSNPKGLYYWTATTGAVDLGPQIQNLASLNWLALSSALYMSADGTIIGYTVPGKNAYGSTLGSVGSANASQEIFSVLVPEPGSIGLLALGAVGLLRLNRRQRS